MQLSKLVGAALVVLLLAGCSAQVDSKRPASVEDHPEVRTTEPEKTYTVPSVIGMTVAQAQSAILDAGGFSDAASDDGKGAPASAWSVVSQTPEPGTKVKESVRVKYVAHAIRFTVPNLVGQTVAAAQQSLTSLGGTLAPTSSDSTQPTVQDSWVISKQSLIAGSLANGGSVIMVTVTAPPPPPPMITYTVTGNGTSNVITYSTGGTGSSQATDVRLPWSTQIPAAGGSFAFYYVSAQDGTGTSITCTITRSDGTVIASNTATGRYAIAQCSS